MGSDRYFRLTWLVALFFAVFATAVPAYLQGQAPGLFSVTVLSVPAGEFTNAQPPQVRIKVTEILSGEQKLEVKNYVWETCFPFHCTVGEDENVASWNRQPIDVPKVGTKWLIYQSAVGPMSFERLPDSVENRKTLQTRLQQEVDFIETNRANAEQAKADFLKKRDAWDHSFGEKELRAMVEAADTIAIGIPSTSSSDQQTFEITEVLKGTPLFTKPELSYMSLRGLGENQAYRDALWTRDDRVLVFLREQPIFVVAHLSHAPAGRGVMLWSADRVSFVKTIVASDTAAPRKQLVFFGGLGASSKIAEKLSAYRTVVSQYSYLPDIKAIQDIYPTADWIIGLDELAGPARSEVSIQRRDSPDKKVERQWAGSLADNVDNVKAFIQEQIN
jgi:hypothetical protein